VKRPGTLQHGDDVDPEDEDEDGPEGKSLTILQITVAGTDDI
jgi:hypothetical protein